MNHPSYSLTLNEVFNYVKSIGIPDTMYHIKTSISNTCNRVVIGECIDSEFRFFVGYDTCSRDDESDITEYGYRYYHDEKSACLDFINQLIKRKEGNNWFHEFVKRE
jgi:hypothetical protein